MGEHGEVGEKPVTRVIASNKMFKRKKSSSNLDLSAVPKFTKNIALQTEQLKVSLDIQREATNGLREEMAALNKRLDNEVMERQDAELDVEQIQVQVDLLLSKVKSLEGQYEDE